MNKKKKILIIIIYLAIVIGTFFIFLSDLKKTNIVIQNLTDKVNGFALDKNDDYVLRIKNFAHLTLFYWASLSLIIAEWINILFLRRNTLLIKRNIILVIIVTVVQSIICTIFYYLNVFNIILKALGYMMSMEVLLPSIFMRIFEAKKKEETN